MRRGSILFVNHSSKIGGGERSLLGLAGALESRGHRVGLLLPGPGPLADRARECGVPVFLCSKAPRRPSLHEMVQGGLRANRNLKTRYVHANSLPAAVLALIPAFLVARRPSVHVRTLSLERRLNPVIRWSIALLLRYCRRVVTISRAARSALRRDFATAEFRCRVVYNGVDPDLRHRASAPPADLQALTDAPIDATVAAVVGRMVPWKRIEDAILAVEAVNKSQGSGKSAFRLAIIGDTIFESNGYRDSLQHLVEQRKLEHIVRFLGHREDVLQLLRGADILLLPSRGEAFGRVVVEAMLSGAVVVARDGEGPGEIIHDGQTGFLYTGDAANLAVALRRAITTSNLESIRARADLVARREFSTARMAERFASCVLTSERHGVGV